MDKARAGRNQTIELNDDERLQFQEALIDFKQLKSNIPLNTIVRGEVDDAIKFIPDHSVDLLFLDPPYNLSKRFNNERFNKTSAQKYTQWFTSWFNSLIVKLKVTASVYICGDWRTSISIYEVIKDSLIIRNRITWEREKGRGAKRNFKNSHEDIWFATNSQEYTFNLEDVKLKRRVIAPYRNNGLPKDWQKEGEEKFRLTHPSNLWNDISIPFWSMPENTDHPTQKPEKLLAKLILASTNPGDVIFDPFLGSGTTAVAAKKLGRQYYGIEKEDEYIMLALKRLKMADQNTKIQGYHDGVFWERNSWPQMSKTPKRKQ